MTTIERVAAHQEWPEGFHCTTFSLTAIMHVLINLIIRYTNIKANHIIKLMNYLSKQLVGSMSA